MAKTGRGKRSQYSSLNQSYTVPGTLLTHDVNYLLCQSIRLYLSFQPGEKGSQQHDVLQRKSILRCKLAEKSFEMSLKHVPLTYQTLRTKVTLWFAKFGYPKIEIVTWDAPAFILSLCHFLCTESFTYLPLTIHGALHTSQNFGLFISKIDFVRKIIPRHR